MLFASADSAAAFVPPTPDSSVHNIHVGSYAAAPALLEPVPSQDPALSPKDRLIALVQAAWPEDPATATRILICESQAGEHADTFSVDAPNGGPMQLNRDTWAGYFQELYGWTWEQVVTDIGVHLKAARVIYDRAGDWTPWRCY